MWVRLQSYTCQKFQLRYHILTLELGRIFLKFIILGRLQHKELLLYLEISRLAQTVAGWQAACEDRQNF